jgi:hypothetical protein
MHRPVVRHLKLIFVSQGSVRQAAGDSSDPSGQSLMLSHTYVETTHLWFDLHLKTLLLGQEKGRKKQSVSSDPSSQSFLLSHIHSFLIHQPVDWHLNSFSWHAKVHLVFIVSAQDEFEQ